MSRRGYSKMNTKDQTEDLLAFENRLTEYVSYMEAKSTKWRVIMVIAVLFVMLSVWNAWRDDTKYNTYSELLWAHKELTGSFTIFLMLCLAGGLQKSRRARIITQRCRNVLKNYNMSCDEQGKLILKRPIR